MITILAALNPIVHSTNIFLILLKNLLVKIILESLHI